VLAERPRVVSFHLGIPAPEQVQALRDAGIVLLGSATSVAEAHALAHSGMHAVIAQGYEAGGHRGVFDPLAADEQLGTLALTRLLVSELSLPVIAAGGIMDGAGIAAALRLGASAAQLGTAFVACPESAASPAHRAALLRKDPEPTLMTRAHTGRPARCLPNRVTALAAGVTADDLPDYPLAFDAVRALQAGARARGELGFDAHYAGQGAPLSRALPATELVATLVRELARA
jgi:nitronate monooxygenase